MTLQAVPASISGVVGRHRPSSPKQYRDALIARTKAARQLSGLSREILVAKLSERVGQKLKLDAYKKWETRTPIPHLYIIPFCELTGVDPWMLLTGTAFSLGRQILAQDDPPSVTRIAQA